MRNKQNHFPTEMRAQNITCNPSPVRHRSQVLQQCLVLALVVTCALPVVTGQLTKTGTCPRYQTDRAFDAHSATKLVGRTFHITHALPNEQEANITCPSLTFDKEGTFKYHFVSSEGVLTYYDGEYEIQPTTLSNPGKIDLFFKYIDILGSDIKGQSSFYVLWVTFDKLLTLASCVEGAFKYRREYLYSMASFDVASLPPFPTLQQELLIQLQTPNSRQLQAVPCKF